MNTYIYVTLAGEDKLRVFQLDSSTGALTNVETVSISGGPAPLAVDPRQRLLYVGQRTEPKVSTYQIDPSSGRLALLGTAGLDADPCYLATDRSGRYLFSAHYGAGKVMVHAIGRDGAVARTIQSVPTAAHAHCIHLDRQNRFVFVPHTMEPNVIYQFLFDEESGQLTPNPTPKIFADAGQGPRHYVYHPTLDVVYVSNENGSSVTAYQLDTGSGSLTPFQTLSTLPVGWTGSNTCAQIHLQPSGRFLYVSNRGHDSISCFAVDSSSGELTALGQQPTEATPRVFGIDPSGSFLYAAGQTSGKLAAYRIDPARGTLRPLQVYEVGARPLWVLALAL